MSTPLFGHTRSLVRERYALLDPAGFVPGFQPGWSGVTVHTVIAPALGADFVQTHFLCGDGAAAAGHSPDVQTCLFLVEGGCSLECEGETRHLTADGYAWLPPDSRWSLTATPGTRLVTFDKVYEPLAGAETPAFLTGNAADVPGQAFLGDPDARLQVLLPDHPAFDMAVNLFTYQPGATLPMVETHVMEHGLLMLSGQGIYRLGDEWLPVRAGDVIWMGPWCPQWFVAMGKEPASYLYYKNVNRAHL